MKALPLLTLRALVTLFTPRDSRGARALLAEDLLLMQELLAVRRFRGQSPILRSVDRLLFKGMSAVFDPSWADPHLQALEAERSLAGRISRRARGRGDSYSHKSQRTLKRTLGE